MHVPSYSDVETAARRIAGHAVKTPLIESTLLNDLTGGRVFLKAECLQRTGSFKFRGAYNAISRLAQETDQRAVLAVSSGNHAQGIAEAARLLDFSATIIMPADAPTIKMDRTRRAGATIVEYDRYSQDREELAHKIEKETGAALVHPYDNFDVIAGQGTVGMESAAWFKEQGLTCDRALVCAGGGGLMSGVLIGMRDAFPDIAVHPVEPEHYDDHRRTIETGEICDADISRPSVCDAILAPRPGKFAHAMGKGQLAPGLVITDQQALDAVTFAFRELKLVVEPGGAAALAALLSGAIDIKGETVMATLSGGNIDEAMMASALSGDG